MIREDGKSSQKYREEHKDWFKKLDAGKYGGYRQGIQNGPVARSKARVRKGS